MKEFVVGFLFSPDGDSVALIRKSKPDWQKGKLNGVGGKIEPGETPLAAMVREFTEEAGFPTVEADWTHTVTLHHATTTIYFFRAQLAYAPPVFAAVSEDEPVNWYRREILPLACVPNAYWLIPLSYARDLQFPVDVFDILPEAEWGKAGAA